MKKKFKKLIMIAGILLGLVFLPYSAHAENITVDCQRYYEDSMEYCIFTAYNEQNSPIWTYTSDKYGATELYRVGLVEARNSKAYIIEGGTVIALDLESGQEIWRNSDYGGAASCAHVFSSSGKLYLSGYYGPDFFVVDEDGQTIGKKDQIKEGYMWPYKIEFTTGDNMRIYFGYDNSSLEFNVTDYFFDNTGNVSASSGTSQSAGSYESFLDELRDAIMNKGLDVISYDGSGHNIDNLGLSENAREFFSGKIADAVSVTLSDEAMYALTDLNGDGSDELLLTTNADQVDCIYTMINGAVTFVASYNYRGTASVHESMICAEGSGGAANYGYSFCMMDESGNLNTLDSIEMESGTYYRGSIDNQNVITEEEANTIIDAYKTGSSPDYVYLIQDSDVSSAPAESSTSDAEYEPDIDTGDWVINSAHHAGDTNHQPFYGIWCTASKDLNEAVSAADWLISLGISAYVFDTAWYSNLNSESWFVVSAGIYYDEASAYDALGTVQSYYPDAYVKYSGDWIG